MNPKYQIIVSDIWDFVFRYGGFVYFILEDCQPDIKRPIPTVDLAIL